jgi:hypothetical protein
MLQGATGVGTTAREIIEMDVGFVKPFSPS